MDGKIDSVQDFLNQIWSFVADKHNQGVYNTVCLVVLLILPLLVLLTTLLVCCHCCCCRHDSRCCHCCCKTKARSETKKKKSSGKAEEDLWISVKTGAMTPDRVALTMV